MIALIVPAPLTVRQKKTTAGRAILTLPTTAPKIAPTFGVAIHGAAIVAAWRQETPEMIAMIVREHPMAVRGRAIVVAWR